MEVHDLVERVFQQVEDGHVDKAASSCLRIARKLNDTFNVIMFSREMSSPMQTVGLFHDDIKHLNQEARDTLLKTTRHLWMVERTLDILADPDDENRNVLTLGVGELHREVERLTNAISDFKLPPGMGEFDTAAFTDRYDGLKSDMHLRIMACNTVLERVRTRCLNFASRVENQLTAQKEGADFISSILNDVHNYFAVRSESAYQRISKAAQLIGSTDSEDHSLLLTEIRRAIKAVADYYYPPVSGPVRCQDGKERELGEEQYLNRLQEFVGRRFPATASNKLLKAELDYLSAFARRLNDVASKGVHTDISAAEARQGLLGLYIFLSNLILKLEEGT